MKTAYLKISGKVQGVFFRAEARENAEANKISGWIRNTDDDEVEACITGDDKAVEEFILWCRHGPEKAKVENVLVKYADVKEFDKFKVIR